MLQDDFCSAVEGGVLIGMPRSSTTLSRGRRTTSRCMARRVKLLVAKPGEIFVIYGYVVVTARSCKMATDDVWQRRSVVLHTRNDKQGHVYSAESIGKTTTSAKLRHCSSNCLQTAYSSADARSTEVI